MKPINKKAYEQKLKKQHEAKKTTRKKPVKKPRVVSGKKQSKKPSMVVATISRIAAAETFEVLLRQKLIFLRKQPGNNFLVRQAALSYCQGMIILARETKIIDKSRADEWFSMLDAAANGKGGAK